MEAIRNEINLSDKSYRDAFPPILAALNLKMPKHVAGLLTKIKTKNPNPNVWGLMLHSPTRSLIVKFAYKCTLIRLINILINCLKQITTVDHVALTINIHCT